MGLVGQNRKSVRKNWKFLWAEVLTEPHLNQSNGKRQKHFVRFKTLIPEFISSQGKKKDLTFIFVETKGNFGVNVVWWMFASIGVKEVTFLNLSRKVKSGHLLQSVGAAELSEGEQIGWRRLYIKNRSYCIRSWSTSSQHWLYARLRRPNLKGCATEHSWWTGCRLKKENLCVTKPI